MKKDVIAKILCRRCGIRLAAFKHRIRKRIDEVGKRFDREYEEDSLYVCPFCNVANADNVVEGEYKKGGFTIKTTQWETIGDDSLNVEEIINLLLEKLKHEAEKYEHDPEGPCPLGRDCPK